MLACGLLAAGAGTLTFLGLKDSPAHAEPGTFSPLAIAGAEFAADQRCAAATDRRRRQPGPETRSRRTTSGARPHQGSRHHHARIAQTAARAAMRESQARSVISYLQHVRAGGVAPSTVEHKQGIVVYGAWCASCHIIDGEGVKNGPDLTRIGEKRDAKWLQSWIADPEADRREGRHAVLRGSTES
jgi:mono/diheme cytochrome c family protein